jgi:hypothetical protein
LLINAKRNWVGGGGGDATLIITIYRCVVLKMMAIEQDSENASTIFQCSGKNRG